MSVICPNCDNEYEHIGKHWYASSSCSYPKLTNYQNEVITGLLMGDGSVISEGGNSNSYITSCMITKEYLEYLNQEVFPIVGSNVRLEKTAKQQAKHHRDSGFRKNADAENYSDVYRWSSRNHPAFNEYRKWYSTGKKIFPNDIKMTPTVLKHWFVTDGNFNKGKYKLGRISIATSNETSKDKLESYFDSTDIDDIYWKEFKINERDVMHLCFSSKITEKVFDYMGSPLPGFQYKWPEVKINE